MNIFIVALGGGFGAALRYGMGISLYRASEGFPLATFCINLLGAFAIGIISACAGKYGLDPRFVLFLRAGVCGGFTTFSTFSIESLVLLEQGKIGIALAYIISSVILGVLAVYLGQVLVK